jgi:hypothetical protein
MTIRLHSAVLATILAATGAVGIAGATVVQSADFLTAPKEDRLDVGCDVASAAGGDFCTPANASYVTVEERGEGVSTLIRVPSDG